MLVVGMVCRSTQWGISLEHKSTWLGSILLALFIAGCGGDRSATSPTERAEPTTVSVLTTAEEATAGASQSAETEEPEPASPAPTVAEVETPVATAGRQEATATPSQNSTPAARATRTPERASAARFNPQDVSLRLEVVAEGFAEPLFVTHAGDGSGRVFVVEKGGVIRLLKDKQPFLDITDRVGAQGSEQGLLGLAFHPRFRQNGYFYVNYTNQDGDSVISRFTAPGDRQRADAGSERVVLTEDQPAANHNGGMLAFGRDGYLYAGFGDGGGANDQFGNGQNRNTLLGKILRIDVNRGSPYAIPQDNPFRGEEGVRAEIYAYGLRNPWRFSFDRDTGDLYIGDVGQGQYEWVLYQRAGTKGGQNYGWPITEGDHCFLEEGCNREGITPPVTEYTHDLGCSITGGYVYRGERYPALRGAYLFGDYCDGRVWTLHRDRAGKWIQTEMLQEEISISSFGEDEAGEVYITDLASGNVYQVAASTD